MLLGGHDVPEDVVRRGFAGGLRNFFAIYQPVMNSWQMFDNSDLSGPTLIASRRSDQSLEIRREERKQRPYWQLNPATV